MRSSKQRSRNKSNRNRPAAGNVVNRVFDSSGPEGKVRGTPQQIIEKYNQLARDAQLAGDRVATENFQQHAEHYTRMLAEAMKEQEARREAQEAQHRERQQNQQNQQNQQTSSGRTVTTAIIVTTGAVDNNRSPTLRVSLIMRRSQSVRRSRNTHHSPISGHSHSLIWFRQGLRM